MKHLLLFIFLLFSFNLIAQDIIIKRNGDEIKSKILEITSETIKYKKFEFQDGPIRNINISDVFMVIYENGEREKFTTTENLNSKEVAQKENLTITESLNSTEIIKKEVSNNDYPVEIYSDVKLNTKFKKINSQNFDFLKGEKKMNIEYVYDSMAVGEYANEQDWVSKKVVEQNAEETGKGDAWAIKWKADREERFQPSLELITNRRLKKIDVVIGNYRDVKYTIIAKTTFTEPGYYAGVTCKFASIDVEFIFIETGKPENILGKIVMKQQKRKAVWQSALYRQRYWTGYNEKFLNHRTTHMGNLREKIMTTLFEIYEQETANLTFACKKGCS